MGKSDGFTGPRQEIDIRYEFYLKITLKHLGCEKRVWTQFLLEFLRNN